METQDPLGLSNDQLAAICDYAERVQNGENAELKHVAFALQAVSLCLHRLQAGEPEADFGESIDLWYDKVFGPKIRVMWTKVKPVDEKLRERGILPR